MNKIKDVLKKKGNDVYVTYAHHTVYQALEELIDKNVGALVVLSEDNDIVGMFSERDYTRKVALQGKSSKNTRVEEIMSSQVITVNPDLTVNYCMGLMTDQHIRHLPVIAGNDLIGLVSIGDLVKFVIQEQEETIESLKGYISN